MAKILEADFRKELYKSLMEAGYSKDEAQKIVGVKYYKELHNDAVNDVETFLKSLVSEEFNVSLDYEAVSSKLSELKKLKELLKA